MTFRTERLALVLVSICPLAAYADPGCESAFSNSTCFALTSIIWLGFFLASLVLSLVPSLVITIGVSAQQRGRIVLTSGVIGLLAAPVFVQSFEALELFAEPNAGFNMLVLVALLAALQVGVTTVRVIALRRQPSPS